MRNFPTETATLLLVEEPDARLLQLAAECGGTLVTNHSTLRQTAEEQGVPVMTVHELALALAPKVRPGSSLAPSRHPPPHSLIADPPSRSAPRCHNDE